MMKAHRALRAMLDGSGVGMGGIEHVARSVSAVLQERLPWQRKTQREDLSLLVATMLSERSANLMSLAAALPRPADRVEPRGSPGIDMRYQWIVRVLTSPLIECDAVMLPFAREVLEQAQAEAGRANTPDPGSEPGVQTAPDPRAGSALQRMRLAAGLASGRDRRRYRLCGAEAPA